MLQHVALRCCCNDLPLVWHAGMPYPWVNLRHGMHANETVFETNTAAVGSFSIEMGLLSRLTGGLTSPRHVTHLPQGPRTLLPSSL